MKKIIIVLMLLALSVGMVGCGGGGSGSSANPGGEKKGVPSVVQLLSTHSIAQTNSTVYLHTKVLDGNGVPVKNEAVTYTNLSEPFGVIKSVLNFLGIQKPLGLLSATVVKTNNLGIATAKLTSTTAGFATIQAEVNTGAGQVRDKRTIFFTTSLTPPTPPSPTIRLHVYDSTNDIPDEPDDFKLFKGGNASDNQRQIKAVVKDGYGRPVSFATVLFVADSPTEVTFSGNFLMTNTSGEVIVNVTVNPAALSNLDRMINIAAGADVDNDGSYDAVTMVSLFIKPVTISGITVNANPSVVAPNANSSILASVRMLGALPVPDGTAVSFETTCGFVTPFGQTVNGLATSTFTAPSVPPSGSCTVTATVGGMSGAADITVSTALNVQPGSQTINGVAGGTATFTIFGGVAPYTVTSNDPDYPAVLTDDIFTVTVPPNSIPKTIAYTVRDSVAVQVTASLIIGGGGSLQVLPSAVTVDSEAPEDTITFTIFGGVAPYFVVSNKPTDYPPSIPTVSDSGGTFVVTVPVNAPTGTVVITIRDSNNPASTTTANITITSGTALNVTPSNVTITGFTNPDANDADNVTFHITGGAPPYSMYSNNDAVISSQGVLAGDTFTIDPEAVASSTTVTLTAVDSFGATKTVTVTVTPALSPMGINPSSITVVHPTTIDYHILGGLPNYTIYSSNLGVIDVGPNPLITGSIIFTASTVAPGTATIYIVDADGRTINANVNVVAPPAPPAPIPPAALNITLNPKNVIGVENVDADPSDNVTFTVTGGSPPYIVTASNPALAPFGTWSLTASPYSGVTDVNNVGIQTTVTMTVVDNVGASASSDLIIFPQASNLVISVNKKNVTGIQQSSVLEPDSADDVTFTVTGSYPPFIVALSSSVNFCTPGSQPCIGNNGPWIIGASGGTQVIDPQSVVSSVTVTLTVTDNNGNIANTDFLVHPD